MQNSFAAHVGGRIRLFRRSRGMTLDELAGKVQKSKATLSKYETGAVVADLETTFRIANALGVHIDRLTDYTAHGKNAPGRGPFGSADRLYVYHRSGGIIFNSELHLFYSDDTVHVTLYYEMTGAEGSGQCRCIYNGVLYCRGAVAAAVLRNYLNPVENVLMNIYLPADRGAVMKGILCGLDSGTAAPGAYRIALAEQPLAADDALRQQLLIPAESFREMRRKNKLFLQLD